MKRCVFSGKTDDLNTSMTIRLDDGTRVEVWISDEFAEEATPKTAKAAYLQRQQQADAEIEELRKRAAALGLTLVDNAAASTPAARPEPLVLQRPTAQLPRAAGPERPAQKPAMPSGTKLVDGRTADSRSIDNLQVENRASGLGVAGMSGQYQVRSTCITCGGSGKIGNDLCPKCKGTGGGPTEDLKEGETAAIERVQGRAGMQVAIPTKRVGKTGTTTVRVVDNGGDAALQRRFKNLAEVSKGLQGPPDFIHGYEVRFVTCGLCSGSGERQGVACPKCGGAGEISISQLG